MPTHRVLILGGGFGGIAAAVALRERLDPTDEIVLIDRRTTFIMGLRKNWAVLDARALSEGERPLARLAERGIRVVRGTIDAIHPAERAVEVDGERWDCDALVVALGAERDPDRVEGFRQRAIDIYDVTQGDRARTAIEAFAGGRLVIGIFGVPYPCPPAPFELAMLIDERLHVRGIRGAVEVFSPLPLSLPILGQAGCGSFESRLEGAGIGFLRNHQATAVEDGAVVFGETRRPFDLLLGVSPHRVPTAVAASGLTGGGPWVKVNPRTLETGQQGVYAIGDVTALPLANGQMLPKAGAFAHAQGEVVAARIAATIGGAQPTATFAGDGACFLETGGGMAAMVTGGFLADPPAVRLTDSSPEHFAAKQSFERERLEAWFGA
ncbi:MAG: NAD(P)/FAD-dependent oxidoreductase [Chloroflexi bacterium]|nr:NAD(P)/FAD-dependent oxidoreductase [Chloroflexota bacterium]HEV8053610.1 FAD/NAD(P)-binding oxidoreductase [Candidatus Limnocylindrales bacterium]